VQSKRRILIFISIIVALSLMAIALVPSWRAAVQSLFYHPTHEVLATVQGDLLNDGSECKAIKYRGSEGIYVEIRQLKSNGDSILVDRVLLPDKQDGLFNFQGNVSRLAVSDIDGDGKLELLAPTFDHQLVPHLNVLHFNPATRRFEPYTPLEKTSN